MFKEGETKYFKKVEKLEIRLWQGNIPEESSQDLIEEVLRNKPINVDDWVVDSYVRIGDRFEKENYIYFCASCELLEVWEEIKQ